MEEAQDIIRADTQKGTASNQSQLKMIDGNEPLSATSMRGSQTNIKASRSLQSAIKAGTKQQQTSQLTRIMNDFAKSFDIRAVIFGTFYRCGFDLHELNASEK